MMSCSSSYIQAGNPNASVVEIWQFVRDPDMDVRRRVAERAGVSLEVLGCLAKDEAWEVRAAVAANSNAQEPTLCRLASDSDPNVRFSMAENHTLPKRILEMLQEDENPYVQCRANLTLGHLRSA